MIERSNIVRLFGHVTIKTLENEFLPCDGTRIKQKLTEP